MEMNNMRRDHGCVALNTGDTRFMRQYGFYSRGKFIIHILSRFDSFLYFSACLAIHKRLRLTFIQMVDCRSHLTSPRSRLVDPFPIIPRHNTSNHLLVRPHYRAYGSYALYLGQNCDTNRPRNPRKMQDSCWRTVGDSGDSYWHIHPP